MSHAMIKNPVLWGGPSTGFQSRGPLPGHFQRDINQNPLVSPAISGFAKSALFDAGRPAFNQPLASDRLFHHSASQNQLYPETLAPQHIENEIVKASMFNNVPHLKIMPPRQASEAEMPGVSFGTLEFNNQVATETPEGVLPRTIGHRYSEHFLRHTRYGQAFVMTADALRTSAGMSLFKEYIYTLAANMRMMAVILVTSALLNCKDQYRSWRLAHAQSGIFANDTNSHAVLKSVGVLHRGNTNIYDLINMVRNAGQEAGASPFTIALCTTEVLSLLPTEKDTEYFRRGPVATEILEQGKDYYLNKGVRGIAFHEEPNHFLEREGKEGMAPMNMLSRRIICGRHYVHTVQTMRSLDETVTFKESSGLGYLNLDQGDGEICVQSYLELLYGCAAFDPDTGDLDKKVYERLLIDSGKRMLEVAQDKSFRINPKEKGNHVDPFINWLPNKDPVLVKYLGQQDTHYTSLEDQKWIEEQAMKKVLSAVTEQQRHTFSSVLAFLDNNYTPHDITYVEAFMYATAYVNYINNNSGANLDNKSDYVHVDRVIATYKKTQTVLPYVAEYEGVYYLAIARNASFSSTPSFVIKKDKHFGLINIVDEHSEIIFVNAALLRSSGVVVSGSMPWPGFSTINNLRYLASTADRRGWENVLPAETWQELREGVRVMDIITNVLESIFDAPTANGKASNFFSKAVDEMATNANGTGYMGTEKRRCLLQQNLFQGPRDMISHIYTGRKLAADGRTYGPYLNLDENTKKVSAVFLNVGEPRDNGSDTTYPALPLHLSLSRKYFEDVSTFHDDELRLRTIFQTMMKTTKNGGLVYIDKNATLSENVCAGHQDRTLEHGYSTGTKFKHDAFDPRKRRRDHFGGGGTSQPQGPFRIPPYDADDFSSERIDVGQRQNVETGYNDIGHFPSLDQSDNAFFMASGNMENDIVSSDMKIRGQPFRPRDNVDVPLDQNMFNEFWIARRYPDGYAAHSVEWGSLRHAVRSMYCGAAVHRDVFARMYQNNVPPPLGMFVYDPFIELSTSSIIFASEGNSGMISYFLQNLSMAHDADHKMVHWNLTYNLGAMVTHPKNVFIFPDAAFAGYHGGGSGRIIQKGIGSLADGDVNPISFGYEDVTTNKVDYNPSTSARSGDRFVFAIGFSKKREQYAEHVSVNGGIGHRAFGLFHWIPGNMVKGTPSFSKGSIPFDSVFVALEKFRFGDISYPFSSSEVGLSHVLENNFSGNPHMLTSHGDQWTYDKSISKYTYREVLGEGALGAIPPGGVRALHGAAVTFEEIARMRGSGPSRVVTY
jgi:hypothetical protein